MLPLLADENLSNDIIRGLLRGNRDVDIVRVQDVGLSGADDPTVLAWAAEHGRVLVTHDMKTVPRYVRERIQAGAPMPGVFEVPQSASLARAIDDLLLLVECSLEGEWEGQILYIPL
jgi:hypothetical protein